MYGAVRTDLSMGSLGLDREQSPEENANSLSLQNWPRCDEKLTGKFKALHLEQDAVLEQELRAAMAWHRDKRDGQGRNNGQMETFLLHGDWFLSFYIYYVWGNGMGSRASTYVVKVRRELWGVGFLLPLLHGSQKANWAFQAWAEAL